MIKCTRIFTRPSVDVLWHNEVIPSDEFAHHMKVTYKDTKKCLSSSNTLSVDKLERVYTATWVSMDAYNEYDKDPALQNYWMLRDEYYASHGVVMSPVVLEEIQ